jgi:hypothetical protein
MGDRCGVNVPDQVRRAALFPEADLPALPPEHPTRRVSVAGVFVRLPAALPVAMVSPGRIDESRVEEVVGEVRRFLRAEGRAIGLWFVAEEALPGDLAERLQTLGMRPSDLPGVEARHAAMVCVEPPPPGPPGVVARRPGSFEEFLVAQRVMCDAFAMDEQMRRTFEERAELLWSVEPVDGTGTGATYVALVDGEVVAFAGALFGRSAVYLGGGGTRPDQRGRGGTERSSAPAGTRRSSGAPRSSRWAPEVCRARSSSVSASRSSAGATACSTTCRRRGARGACCRFRRS